MFTYFCPKKRWDGQKVVDPEINELDTAER